jgi:hypothetical protein
MLLRVQDRSVGTFRSKTRHTEVLLQHAICPDGKSVTLSDKNRFQQHVESCSQHDYDELGEDYQASISVVKEYMNDNVRSRKLTYLKTCIDAHGTLSVEDSRVGQLRVSSGTAPREGGILVDTLDWAVFNVSGVGTGRNEFPGGPLFPMIAKSAPQEIGRPIQEFEDSRGCVVLQEVWG